MKYEHILFVSLAKCNLDNDLDYLWQLSELMRSRLSYALLIPTLSNAKKLRDLEQTYLYGRVLQAASQKLITVGKKIKIPQQDLYLRSGECLFSLLENLLAITRPDLLILSSSFPKDEQSNIYQTAMNNNIAILRLTDQGHSIPAQLERAE